jgi:hypothetical protein
VSLGLILVLVSLFSIISIFSSGGVVKRNEMLRDIAKKLGGLKTSGGDSTYPKIKWMNRILNPVVIHDDYKGHEIDIQCSGSRTPITQIEIKLNHLAKFSVRLRKRDLGTRLLIFAREFKSGNAGFDTAIHQSGNAPRLAGRILSHGLHEKIVSLWKRENCSGIIVMENSRIRYLEPCHIKEDSDARRISELAELLAEIADATETEIEAAGAPLRKRKAEQSH